jgi:hypothetical protein
LSDDQKAEIQAEVMAETDAMMASWNERNLEGAMSAFHPERVSFAWTHTLHKDVQTISERWGSVWETVDAQECSWIDRSFTVFSEAEVLFQGTFEMTMQFDDGRTVHYPGTAHWTALYEPYGDGWKITTSSYTFGGAQQVE